MRDEAERAEAPLLFAVFFALGAAQAAPSVTTGDAGEFTAAAAVLGVAHAPGYPLYVLVAKAFGALVPIGNWAYRTNLLSAACGALALAAFADALRRLGAGRAARLGAAAVLGLSPLWREQSAVTEVFSLHLLFAALLLWIVAAAGERLLEPGPAAALGLTFGLGLGAHQTLALVLPALLLAGRARPGGLPRALSRAALGALAGFSIHAALPLRALHGPPLDWDHAVTASALKRLLLRRDYGSLSLTTDAAASSGPEALAAQAWRSLAGVGRQLGPLGAALALLGAAAWRRSGLRLPAAAAWAWLLAAGPAFLMLGRPPFDPQTSGALERFHLLPLLGAGLFVAAGLEVLWRARPEAGAAAALAASALLAPGAAAEGRRGDFLAHDFGRSILRELPPDAVLAMDGGDDTFYSLSFLKFAQGARPDVRMFDRGGVVFPGAYGADFRALPRELKDDRRRAAEGALAESGRLWYTTLNGTLLPGWDLAPAGLLRRPARPGAPFPGGPALDAALPSPRAPDAARRYRDRALLAFYPYQRAQAARARGDARAEVAWLSAAAAAAGDALWAAPAISYSLSVTGYKAVQRRDWPAAEAAYAAQAAVDPARAEPLSDLGVVLNSAGRPAEAEAALRAAIGRDPRSAHAWEALGSFLWSRGRWSDCAEAYASAAALPGGAADAAWAEKARARARAGR